ncbi:MAG: fatty acid--CoA ligase [Desulfomicrobium sp.]|nr:fatty acid--CoA ligase [Pseudomonadota bacterium]MBU4595234.1 fatty acid--CoA ligase [Pseudomonadota bacterium]MBV1711344.1 fatty acid--CoA ligase [Desulfomicrobium sp.]MBV1720668.1 fatty acid--CoA ligase [Desulfomicrobium sp.]MBV1749133.1 fatty acid--CoA ligase [Desulfomicrobium sp.]
MNTTQHLLIKNILQAPIQDHPDQEIVYAGTLRFTYAQFRERVARLAAMLLDQGVKPGDTVAVMDYDSHRYLECYFAIPMIGAVLHTINIRLSPEQMVYTIGHAEDDVILVNSDFLPLLEQIKGRLDTVEKFILLSDTGDTPTTTLPLAGEYETLLAASTPVQDFPDFDENTRATTFYTTGTTGLPKGVFFSHRQLVLHTLAGVAALGSNATQGRFHREDVYMPITPMFHVHAWGIPYMATLLGVKQVYPGKYIPEVLARLIATEKVTFSHCVPTILHMLLSDPKCAPFDLSAWKVVIGGAAMPKAICAAALHRGIDVFAGYGMSETCPILSLAYLSDAELQLDRETQIALRTRTGKALPMVRLRLIDDLGQEVPNDDKTPGALQVRAPWLTASYLKDESNSKKLWTDGWLNTGDVACRNEAGSLRITDRTKDVIKVGGEWISSLELEDIILQHPDVAEAAVIGKPDLRWGETPLALVVPKKGATPLEREIVQHVKSFVDKGVLPKEAILLKARLVEAIAKTSVGKISKVTMREMYLKDED